MSATELAARIRAREVSPVEAVGAYLRRIDEVNPRLNAVVAVAPDALERAREAEDALMRGDDAGALRGVPLTVKDTVDVRGMPAACGSRVRAGVVPEEDAPAVARLRAAGAIILGKTNCPEFALDYTSENPVYGRTNNPHDPSRTPGGSSGGCAAAVAACLTAGSLGSDLAGSVRIPAHFCGVLALKPTAGRVPGGGQLPPASGLHSLGATLGPLARTVEDLRLLFRILSGRTSSVESEGAGSLKGMRVGFYADAGAVPVSAETRAAVTDAARALAGAGAQVFEAVPPGVESATELWLSLFEYTTRRFIRRVYEGRGEEAGRAARVILEKGARWGEPALEDVLRAWEERDRVRAALLAWMEDVPLYVAPVGAVPAFRHEEFGRLEFEGRSVPTFRAFSYAQAANVFDLPAASVPAGASASGLPVGVQVVGRPHGERLVLEAARVLEEALGGWRPPANARET
ncbi:MAG TPA: amidase [Pyrinomonadaceae bacterium]|jgi:Asp-tRNA(Asn)/Glu-tRNA(Gln) amidotransferase A subunit family amidase